MMNWKETQSKILSGKLSVSAVVSNYIDQCRKIKNLHAYIEVFEEEALERAQLLDDELKDPNHTPGRLFGMVISIKDNLNYKGHSITAGSSILKGYKSIYNATAIQRLLDEDAIIIGRTNCDEFAMGSGTDTSCYGPTRNGDDPALVPGGSSGGAAVSVQMNTCMVALGSDTGGSVRQPASFCNVIGMKPSYGRISRYGLIAYASSFDQIGLLSKDANAIADVLEVIAGHDPYDPTSSPLPVDHYNSEPKTEKYNFAYFKASIDHPSLSRESKKLFEGKISELMNEGHSVEAIEFDYLDYLVPTYYILTTAEASSNLSRYDGVRYGHRSTAVTDVESLYKKSRSEGFGTEVKRRIILGTFVLSEGYFDAYYKKAQASRRLIKEAIDRGFSDYDFILMPSTPQPAWTIGSFVNDPVALYLSDIYTVLANLCGIPAVSIPYDTKSGLGFQIMAAYMQEKRLLHFLNNILIMA